MEGIYLRSYQNELDAILAGLKEKPKLLLHACCAPCCSYVLDYLSPHFSITVFYYNPNIFPYEEYEKRREETRRLAGLYGAGFVSGDWGNEAFESVIHGLRTEPEGGGRCTQCFRIRLKKTAQLAQQMECGYFTTSLTISPLKNAQKLNELSEKLARQYGLKALPSDFKKKDGYKKSILLSQQYGLYRQNYCGCQYSKGMKEHVSNE